MADKNPYAAVAAGMKNLPGSIRGDKKALGSFKDTLLRRFGYDGTDPDSIDYERLQTAGENAWLQGVTPDTIDEFEQSWAKKKGGLSAGDRDALRFIANDMKPGTKGVRQGDQQTYLGQGGAVRTHDLAQEREIAERGGWNNFGRATMQTLGSWGMGIVSAGEYAATGLTGNTPSTTFSRRMRENMGEHWNAEMDSLSGMAGSLAGNIGTSILTMGAGGLAAKGIGIAARGAVHGVSAFGSSVADMQTQEAISGQDEFSTSREVLAGFLIGGAEMLFESLSLGLAGGAYDKQLIKMASKLKVSTAGMSGMQAAKIYSGTLTSFFAKNFGIGGTEEAFTEIAQNLIKNHQGIREGGVGSIPEYNDNVMQAFVMGGIAQGITTTIVGGGAYHKMIVSEAMAQSNGGTAAVVDSQRTAANIEGYLADRGGKEESSEGTPTQVAAQPAVTSEQQTDMVLASELGFTDPEQHAAQLAQLDKMDQETKKGIRKTLSNKGGEAAIAEFDRVVAEAQTSAEQAEIIADEEAKQSAKPPEPIKPAEAQPLDDSQYEDPDGPEAAAVKRSPSRQAAKIRKAKPKKTTAEPTPVTTPESEVTSEVADYTTLEDNDFQAIKAVHDEIKDKINTSQSKPAAKTPAKPAKATDTRVELNTDDFQEAVAVSNEQMTPEERTEAAVAVVETGAAMAQVNPAETIRVAVKALTRTDSQEVVNAIQDVIAQAEQAVADQAVAAGEDVASTGYQFDDLRRLWDLIDTKRAQIDAEIRLNPDNEGKTIEYLRSAVGKAVATNLDIRTAQVHARTVTKALAANTTMRSQETVSFEDRRGELDGPELDAAMSRIVGAIQSGGATVSQAATGVERFYSSLATGIGQHIIWYDGPMTSDDGQQVINGFTTDTPGVIAIQKQADTTAQARALASFTFGHEVGHTILSVANEGNTELRSALISTIIQNTQIIESVAHRYDLPDNISSAALKKAVASGDQAATDFIIGEIGHEAFCDIVGQAFASDTFWKSVTSDSRNKGLFSVIRGFITRFAGTARRLMGAGKQYGLMSDEEIAATESAIGDLLGKAGLSNASVKAWDRLRGTKTTDEYVALLTGAGTVGKTVTQQASLDYVSDAAVAMEEAAGGINKTEVTGREVADANVRDQDARHAAAAKENMLKPPDRRGTTTGLRTDASSRLDATARDTQDATREGYQKSQEELAQLVQENSDVKVREENAAAILEAYQSASGLLRDGRAAAGFTQLRALQNVQTPAQRAAAGTNPLEYYSNKANLSGATQRKIGRITPKTSKAIQLSSDAMVAIKHLSKNREESKRMFLESLVYAPGLPTRTAWVPIRAARAEARGYAKGLRAAIVNRMEKNATGEQQSIPGVDDIVSIMETLTYSIATNMPYMADTISAVPPVKAKDSAARPVELTRFEAEDPKAVKAHDKAVRQWENRQAGIKGRDAVYTDLAYVGGKQSKGRVLDQWTGQYGLYTTLFGPAKAPTKTGVGGLGNMLFDLVVGAGAGERTASSNVKANQAIHAKAEDMSADEVAKNQKLGVVGEMSEEEARQYYKSDFLNRLLVVQSRRAYETAVGSTANEEAVSNVEPADTSSQAQADFLDQSIGYVVAVNPNMPVEQARSAAILANRYPNLSIDYAVELAGKLADGSTSEAEAHELAINHDGREAVDLDTFMYAASPMEEALIEADYLDANNFYASAREMTADERVEKSNKDRKILNEAIAMTQQVAPQDVVGSIDALAGRSGIITADGETVMALNAAQIAQIAGGERRVAGFMRSAGAVRISWKDGTNPIVDTFNMPLTEKTRTAIAALADRPLGMYINTSSNGEGDSGPAIDTQTAMNMLDGQQVRNKVPIEQMPTVMGPQQYQEQFIEQSMEAALQLDKNRSKTGYDAHRFAMRKATNDVMNATTRDRLMDMLIDYKENGINAVLSEDHSWINDRAAILFGTTNPRSDTSMLANVFGKTAANMQRVGTYDSLPAEFRQRIQDAAIGASELRTADSKGLSGGTHRGAFKAGDMIATSMSPLVGAKQKDSTPRQKQKVADRQEQFNKFLDKQGIASYEDINDLQKRAGKDKGAMRQYTRVITEWQKQIIDHKDARWSDPVHELYRNALLSAPMTGFRNIFGGFYAAYDAMVVEPISRYMVAAFSKDPTSWARASLETKASMMAVANSGTWGDGMMHALQTLMTEMPQYDMVHKGAFDPNVDVYRNKAITGEGTRAILNKLGITTLSDASASAVGIAGRIVRAPQCALGAVDQFVKTIYGRQEAAVQAANLYVDQGMDQNDFQAFEAFVNAQLDDITSQSWQNATGNGRVDAATFQARAGAMEKAIFAMRDAPILHAMVPFIAPFIKTPIQLATRAAEHVPLLGAAMGIYGAKRAKRNPGQYKFTGRDTARHAAKQVLGLLAMGMLWGAVGGDDEEDATVVTGSNGGTNNWNERKVRGMVLPEYSMRIGGEWFSYKNIDPFSTVIAATANAITAMKRTMRTGGDGGDEAIKLVSKMTTMMEDQTYLRGVGDMMKLLREGNEYKYDRYVRDMASSFVPNVIGAMSKAQDDYIRDRSVRGEEGDKPTLMQSIAQNRWASDQAAPRVDMFGADVMKADMGDTGTPVQRVMLSRLMFPFQKKTVVTRNKQEKALMALVKFEQEHPDDAKWPSMYPRSVTVPSADPDRDTESYEMNTKEFYLFSRVAGQIGALHIEGMQNFDPNLRNVDLIVKSMSKGRKEATSWVRMAHAVRKNQGEEAYRGVLIRMQARADNLKRTLESRPG